MILTRDVARMVCAALVAALLAPGCGDDGTFSCGNGACDLDTEICIIGDGCSSCAPRPTTCEADATCECLPAADDPSWGFHQCDDEGTCSEAEGGLVLTCTMPRWGCG